MFNKSRRFIALLCVTVLYCGIFCILFNNISSVPVLSNQLANTTSLPIIMYHSVLKDTDLSGKYIITPSTLRNDIEYLLSHGYTFVSGEELISHVESGAPLPEKPVMLTFDDGFYNSYGYVLPILEEYNAKAVISVVGSYTDEFSETNIANLTYGYMRWVDVYDMFINSHTEIGNHSYDFHSTSRGRFGAKKNKGESEEAYENLFFSDTKKAQERFMEKTGFAPVIYTYPFGAYTPETTDILKKMGFKMSLICEEGINIITDDPDCLFMLKRYNRPSGIESSEFFKRIQIKENTEKSSPK